MYPCIDNKDTNYYLIPMSILFNLASMVHTAHQALILSEYLSSGWNGASHLNVLIILCLFVTL